MEPFYHLSSPRSEINLGQFFPPIYWHSYRTTEYAEDVEPERSRPTNIPIRGYGLDRSSGMKSSRELAEGVSPHLYQQKQQNNCYAEPPYLQPSSYFQIAPPPTSYMPQEETPVYPMDLGCLNVAQYKKQETRNFDTRSWSPMCQESLHSNKQWNVSPVKLFVNRIPTSMCNDELRNVFSPFGHIMECNILKDSSGHRGCAFVKFSSLRDAQRAILELHGQRVLNGSDCPVQIKYADGEVARALLHDFRAGLSVDVQPGGESVKVFVGCLSKTCTETYFYACAQKTLFNLFCPFGRVDEVFILKNAYKESKRSAFVTFPKMSMALEAIRHLDRKCWLPDSTRVLEVRLANSQAARYRRGGEQSGSLSVTPGRQRCNDHKRRSIPKDTVEKQHDNIKKSGDDEGANQRQ